MLGKYLPFYFADAIFILMRKEFLLTEKDLRVNFKNGPSPLEQGIMGPIHLCAVSSVIAC